MAAAVAGLAAAASAAGGVIGTVSQLKVAQAQKKQIRAQKKQLNLEAKRKQREIIRRSQIARAESESTAVAQGAENTSAFEGGQANITGVAAQGVQASRQNRQTGAAILSAQSQAASAQALGGFGSGLSSLGQILLKNQNTISRLGQNFG